MWDLFWQDKNPKQPFICIKLKRYEVFLAKSCTGIVRNVLLRSLMDRNEREQKEEKLSV